jgi:hypothetical protein
MYNEQLARETLVDGAEYIEKISMSIEEIIENLLAGRENLALKDFVNIVDGFEWLINTLELTKPTQEKLGVVFETPTHFIEIMKEMIEAFENSDYVLLSDLLKYEAKPVIVRWNQQFQMIKGLLS